MNFIEKLNFNYVFILTGVLLLLNLLHLDSQFGVDFAYTYASVLVAMGAFLTIVSAIMLQFVLKEK